MENITETPAKIPALPTRYNAVAVTLHWLIALAIVAMFAMGWTMTDDSVDPMTKFKLFQLHKSVGVTIICLVALRILWRLTHKAPPMGNHFPAWERVAAHLGHLALYALLLAVPLTGWMTVSASPLGIPTIVFGWFEWPHLGFIEPSEANDHFFSGLHELFANWMIIMVALHVGAVIKHFVIDRENILPRMWYKFSSKKDQ